MTSPDTLLLSDIAQTVQLLGHNGGQVSASVYETALVASHAPPNDDPRPALEWLLAQQQADGGWGEPDAGMYRDVPTLAAATALSAYYGDEAAGPVRAAQSFLQSQPEYWATEPGDDAPVAVELTLPNLVEVATRLGVEIDRARHAGLTALGQRRRALIEQFRPLTANHSWEAWGSQPDPGIVDEMGGVGQSPAASAAWHAAAQGNPELAEERRNIERYLARAARATGTDIPGVVPPLWPITDFETVFGLVALQQAGLLGHASLRLALGPKLDRMQRHFGPEGIGASPYFPPDGDDTACAIVVLKDAGRSPDYEALQHYKRGDGFVSYDLEMQGSVSVLAHGLHAMSVGPEGGAATAELLASLQQPDGSWPADKWHSSKFYTISQAMVALAASGNLQPLGSALQHLRDTEHADGGWGTSEPTATETAYVVLALHQLNKHGLLQDGDRAMVARAQAVLESRRGIDKPLWIHKELYAVPRIDKLFVLCALYVARKMGA